MHHPMFNINHYRAIIDDIYVQEINLALTKVSGINNNILNSIKGALFTTGVAVVNDFLIYAFSNSPWDDMAARKIIGSIAVYFIAGELGKYGITVPEFAQSVNYVLSYLNVVPKTQPQQQVPQVSYPNQHMVPSSYAGHRPPPQYIPPSPLVSHSGIYQPQYQPPVQQKTSVYTELEFGDNDMNKGHHIPNPNPHGYAFNATQAPAHVPELNRQADSVSAIIAGRPAPASGQSVRIKLLDKRKFSDNDGEVIIKKINSNFLVNTTGELLSGEHTSPSPIILNGYTEKLIPVIDNPSQEFIGDLIILSTLSKMEDISAVVNESYMSDVLVWLSAQVNYYLLSLLKYRYGISDLNSLAYLTNPIKTNAYLANLGIVDDVETCVVEFINNLFLNHSLSKYDDDGHLQWFLHMVVANNTLVLPWVSAYVYRDKRLKVYSEYNEGSIELLFQDTFSMISDTALSFNIIDTVANRYRVYRIGPKVNTGNGFIVEYID